MTKGKNDKEAQNLFILGYRDYIAARFLLNNNLLIQGATLSCTAIEKYLKALLIAHGFKRKIHIEKWKEIKNCLNLKGIDLFDELDLNFLKLLGNVYKLRYYDRVNNSVCYGFIKWQFLAELDYTVNLIESRTTFTYESGTIWDSPYKSALKGKNDILYLENYVLNEQNKKEYMEREGTSVMVNIDKNQSEIIIEGNLKQDNYKGSMLKLLKMEIK